MLATGLFPRAPRRGKPAPPAVPPTRRGENRVRKLILPIVPLCLVAAPAVALAAGGASSAAEPAGGAGLISAAPFTADPFHAAQARGAARAAVKQAKREARPPEPKVAVPPALEAIAACESGGDPTAVSSTGAYRGKYQFSPATWQAVGGTGDPAAAPESEQDLRATILYEQSGPGQWPVCSG